MELITREFVFVPAEIIWKILRHIRCVILNAWNSNEKALEENEFYSNIPFPSFPKPRFQSDMKMIFYSYANKTHLIFVRKVLPLTSL